MEMEQEEERPYSRPSAGAEMKVDVENSALDAADAARIENEKNAEALVRAADDAREAAERDAEARRISMEAAADEERQRREEQEEERRVSFENARAASEQQRQSTIVDKSAADKEAADAMAKKLQDISAENKGIGDAMAKETTEQIDKQHEDIAKQLEDADARVAAAAEKKKASKPSTSHKVSKAPAAPIGSPGEQAPSHKAKASSSHKASHKGTKDDA